MSFDSNKMIIPGTVVSVAPGTKGSTELKYTSNKSGKELRDLIFSKNANLISMLKELKVGQKIKVQKEKKEGSDFFNVVAVYKDDGTTGTNKTSSATTSNTDFNVRAGRGQALNLAVAVAVAEGKHQDDSFILEQVERFLKLGETVQAGSVKKETTTAKKTKTVEKEVEQEEDPF